MKKRILSIAYSIDTSVWNSNWFASKAIDDWFDYHNDHGFDSDDLNGLGITQESSDEEIKTAIIKQWNDEAEELREEREFQVKHDLGIV